MEDRDGLKLANIVGHELRNPLTAIVSTARLLQNRQPSPDQVQRAAARILSCSARMQRLLDDLAEYTRSLSDGFSVARAEVDVAEVCAAQLGEMELAFPGRTIAYAPQGDGRGQWDAGRLEQLLGNLLGNALKYGAPDRPVVLRWRGLDRSVVLEVQNEGEPIPPGLLPRIFEPFTRGEHPGQMARAGLGLGLHIVRLVAQAHGGTVAVRSTREAGTTFELTLPRA